ncbi:MAG TPA: hypothetical protein VNB06_16405 [Thermoanaerobaculia bacterium]|nr:hypothetical protein [Thermoanaerobaculia bacterium]
MMEAMVLVLVSWIGGAVVSFAPVGEVARAAETATAEVGEGRAAVVESGGTVVELVEMRGRTFRGPKEAGVGKLTIEDDWVRWENDRKRKRSFSMQSRVVREATLVCASRAGGNVCLELELRTVTGEKYRFRDLNWSAGNNQEIRRAYEVLQREHPRIMFGERVVDKIR